MAYGYETDGEVLDVQGSLLEGHGQHVRQCSERLVDEASLTYGVFDGFDVFLPDLRPAYEAVLANVEALLFNVGGAFTATGTAMRDAARDYVEQDRRAVQELIRAQREPDTVAEL